MDELLQLLNTFLVQVQENFDDLSDEEASEITRFLSEVTGFISEQEGREEPIGEVEQPANQSAGLIWVLANGDPNIFRQYLQNFPDPALNALARNPQAVNQLIQQLQQTVTLPAGESEEGIAKASPNSSNVYGFRYSPKDGKLLVRFNSGSVYKYDGVPPQIFKMFQAGAIPAKTNGQNQWGKWWVGKRPSLGSSFHQLIRLGGFPYSRIS